MGQLDNIETLKQEIEDAARRIAGEVSDFIGGPEFVVLGESVGKVVGFRILPSGETGFPHLELTFTDRGLYSYNGRLIPGGTNATYHGFMGPDLIFYAQGNGMSVAMTNPRTEATWFTEGVAKLEPSLTGAGTYRGSILYRWAPGPFAELNPMPAIFRFTIDEQGNTSGTIWRWVKPGPKTDTSDTKTNVPSDRFAP